ncbi:MAG: hypothetical protein SFY80_10285 [Verrucomicrobiota bacterium]|nr:hypothetical protein [Verrucomicrobiota bacterium]
MFTETSFVEFARDLAALNHLPEDTAGECAAIIGDTPEMDSDGKAVVLLADGRELHLILPE